MLRNLRSAKKTSKFSGNNNLGAEPPVAEGQRWRRLFQLFPKNKAFLSIF